MTTTSHTSPIGEDAAILRRLQNTLQLNHEIGAENAAIYAETLDKFIASAMGEDAANEEQEFRSIEDWERHYLPNGLPERPEFETLSAAHTVDAANGAMEVSNLAARIKELAAELDGYVHSGAKMTAAEHGCMSVAGELHALSRSILAALAAEKVAQAEPVVWRIQAPNGALVAWAETALTRDSYIRDGFLSQPYTAARQPSPTAPSGDGPVDSIAVRNSALEEAAKRVENQFGLGTVADDIRSMKLSSASAEDMKIYQTIADNYSAPQPSQPVEAGEREAK